MVPPIKLWDAGRAQPGGAGDHDPQLADARVAGRRPRRRVLGLPDGRAPARRAVRPLRPRRRSRPASTRSSTAPPRRTAARSWPRSRTAPRSGRTTPSTTASTSRRLHTQRITLTRTPADDPDGERLVLDFTGTSPQAKGPINHCGDYADGNFLKKWLAPILRNLADTPERMAELDVNEGIVPLIEMRFPPPGTLLTPVFPAPTNARTFVILRLLGVLAGVLAKAVDGRMPADQETIRYTGVYGDDLDGRPYLMREVLGGGSGGRYYADGEDTIHVVPDSRNLPTEFTESRFPFLVERLGAGGRLRRRRASSAAASATRSTSGCSRTRTSCRSPTARSWPAGASRAARPASRSRSTIDPGGPDEREVDALADAEPVRGRRGDPDPHDRRRRLGRPAGPRPGAASSATSCGARSPPRRALADYGVVLTGSLDDDDLGVRRGRDRRRASRADPSAERAVLRPRPRLRPARRRGRRTPTSTGCDRRESAVLGGTGKTGRAVALALSATGRDPVALGPSGLGGPRRARLPAAPRSTSSLRTCILTSRRTLPEALTAARSAGVDRVVYHSVTAPYAPSMPHHLGKAEGRGRRPPFEADLDGPAAVRLRAELRPEPDGEVRLRVDAPFGFADLNDSPRRPRWC